MKALATIISILPILLVASASPAKDFGTRGKVQTISEQPFLEMVKERLQKVDMQKERTKMEAIAKTRIDNPVPVAGVTPATTAQTFYYDPTYSLDEDAVLPCGRILHKAGTMVNPLEYMEFDRRLIFVDAREQSQIKWLKQMITLAPNNNLETKIILVGGSPLKLQEELSVPIYFDQHGSLTTQFGVEHSPAILVQEGLRIKIEEFKVGRS